MLRAMARTIAELLQQAERHGDAPFLCAGGGRCTFAGYVDRVRRAAGALRERGLLAGERVALLLPRGDDEAVLLLAVMLAGGIAVPVHGKLKDDQVRHVLRDCAPRFVVADDRRTVGLRAPADVLRGFELLGPAQLGGSDPAPVASWAIGPDDVAVLLYTSGSTGPAKGIAQTHGNLVLGAQTVADYLVLSSQDHLLVLLSFSFDYGLNQLLSALWVGARLTVRDHIGVGELGTLLRAVQPTGLAGVPSLWHDVATGLGNGVLGREHGRSLRYLTNSGGALRPGDAQVIRGHWPHVDVFAMYGLTEAFRSAFLPPAEFDEHPDSFGYPIAGVELLLVDPRTGAVLEGPGQGELVHCGALVAQGYWRRPRDEAVRFRPDPRGGDGRAVYSGDLVRRDRAGRHYFVARMDRMLKVAGHRVSPDEVADAVRGMDGVGEVFVFGVAGGADGDRIVLCLVGDPDDAELLAAVRRRCRSRLPSYMSPQVVRVLSSLPLNANGKVDEAVLRQRIEACTDAT